jgi:hypothetical protein
VDHEARRQSALWVLPHVEGIYSRLALQARKAASELKKTAIVHTASPLRSLVAVELTLAAMIALWLG